jgi:hypothetical protein
MPPFRADCVRQSWSAHAHEGLPRPDLPRTPPVTRWSRHRLEADTAGLWLRRSYAADLPSRHTSPALAKKRWARGPLRTACSRRPPAVRLPLQAGGSAGRSVSVPFTRVNRTAPFGSAGRAQGALARPPGVQGALARPPGPGLLAQSAHPGPRAASPASPRRATRSAAPEVPSIEALPSSTTLGLRRESLSRPVPACAGAVPGPSSLSRAHLGRELSTASHQPVESTRCLFRIST